jgi:hypothetical protein
MSADSIGWKNIGKSNLSALSCSSIEVAATQSLNVMMWWPFSQPLRIVDPTIFRDGANAARRRLSPADPGRT